MANYQVYGKNVTEMGDEEQKRIMQLLEDQQKIYEKESRRYVGIDRSFLMDSKRITADLIKTEIDGTNIVIGGICETAYSMSVADWHKLKHAIDNKIEVKTNKLLEQIKRMDGETARLCAAAAALDDPEKDGEFHFPC